MYTKFKFMDRRIQWNNLNFLKKSITLRTQNLKSLLLESAYRFCETTTLHGFNYLVMKSSTKLDRIFWRIVVILSLIVGIVLLTLLWAWNTKDPTFSTVETLSYNTKNIRFPAVTICNFNNISRKKALKLASTLRRPKNITDENVAELFLLTVSEKDPVTSKAYEKNALKYIMEQNNLSVGVLLESIQPNCLEMFQVCLWEGVEELCLDLFQPIAVETTICCTTNFFASKRQRKMKIAKRVLKKALRSYGAGYAYGLTIGVNSLSEDYYGITAVNSRGFTVHIHDANTYPVSNSRSKAVVYGRENFLQVTPISFYTTAAAAALSPEKRNCLLPHERKMISTKYYTLSNCLFECEAMWRLKVCGCFFPLLIRNPSSSNCTLEQYWCLMRLINFIDEGPKDLPKSLYCNCLPECNKNEYSTFMTTGRLIDKVTYSVKDKEPKPFDIDTIIHIHFATVMSTRIRRDISEDWFTTMSSYGGILSLVMGFSIISILESIYICIFRPNIDFTT